MERPIITINTFDFVDKDHIPNIALSDASINKRFERIQENVKKGNAYPICRIEFGYFMRLRYLENEVRRLRIENRELKNGEKTIVMKSNPVRYDKFEPWIDNGQPDESWREIHEMGSL